MINAQRHTVTKDTGLLIAVQEENESGSRRKKL